MAGERQYKIRLVLDKNQAEAAMNATRASLASVGQAARQAAQQWQQSFNAASHSANQAVQQQVQAYNAALATQHQQTVSGLQARLAALQLAARQQAAINQSTHNVILGTNRQFADLTVALARDTEAQRQKFAEDSASAIGGTLKATAAIGVSVYAAIASAMNEALQKSREMTEEVLRMRGGLKEIILMARGENKADFQEPELQKHLGFMTATGLDFGTAKEARKQFFETAQESLPNPEEGFAGRISEQELARYETLVGRWASHNLEAQNVPTAMKAAGAILRHKDYKTAEEAFGDFVAMTQTGVRGRGSQKITLEQFLKVAGPFLSTPEGQGYIKDAREAAALVSAGAEGGEAEARERVNSYIRGMTKPEDTTFGAFLREIGVKNQDTLLERHNKLMAAFDKAHAANKDLTFDQYLHEHESGSGDARFRRAAGIFFQSRGFLERQLKFAYGVNPSVPEMNREIARDKDMQRRQAEQEDVAARARNAEAGEPLAILRARMRAKMRHEGRLGDTAEGAAANEATRQLLGGPTILGRSLFGITAEMAEQARIDAEVQREMESRLGHKIGWEPPRFMGIPLGSEHISQKREDALKAGADEYTMRFGFGEKSARGSDGMAAKQRETQIQLLQALVTAMSVHGVPVNPYPMAGFGGVHR